MVNLDQRRALQALGDAIRKSVEILGPDCTSGLLGTVALDLVEAARPADNQPDVRRPRSRRPMRPPQRPAA